MAKFFIFPFGTAGDRTAIPDDTQPSGAVSYEDGFTVDYQKDLATDPDAKPVPRAQTNQLYFDITDAIRQYQTLGTPDFITTADNGGVPFPYDIYARVRYDDGGGFQVYESLEDANVALPSDATKWRVISNNLQGVQAGTIIDWAGPEVPTGYLYCDGSAVSRTTYAALMANITSVQTGTLTNGLDTVSGLTSTANIYVGMKVEGTGVPAGATVATVVDANNITLSANATTGGAQSLTFFSWGSGDGSTTFNVPDLRRYTTIGFGGTPTSIVGAKTGQRGGSETHTQSLGELAAHTHNAHVSTADTTVSSGRPYFGFGDNAAPGDTAVTASTGSSDPMNIMQPSAVVVKCIKT